MLVLALAVLLLGPGAALSQNGPSVTGLAVSSSPASDDTYILGDVISITLTFSEAVNVTGSPQLKIDMDPADWGEKWAGYASGSGTDSLTFSHTVVEPNYSTQGIAVLENSLALNGGSIKSASSDTNADLTYDGRDHDARHKVDWRLPAATVTDVRITSDAGDDDTYARDEAIRITLTFSEAVTVTGTPRLKIDMDPAEWGEKWAGYHSGSGSHSLTFTHTVVEPNYSSRGIAVLENTLALNGGSIRSDGLPALLDHTGLPHDSAHKVDWQRSRSNRAPVINTETRNYDWFIGQNNASRGILVSKPFYQVFTDPDGDNLTYAVSVANGDSGLVDLLTIGGHGNSDEQAEQSGYSLEAVLRVFFRAEDETDWKGKSPALPDHPVVTVTLTATDPEGLSVSLGGDFLIWWESHPEVVSAVARERAIALTFDVAVEDDPAPTAGQFTVKVVNGDGTAGTVGVSSVSVNGSVVTLALGAELATGQTVTVDYTHDDDTPLKRASEGGDTAPDFTGQAVDMSSFNCELAPPEGVSMLGVAKAGVATWQAPLDDDACEPTGYLVGARSLDDGEWVVETAPPEARSYLLDDLTPGTVEYYVTTIYPEGPSKRPRTLPQIAVPEACNLSLTVEANVDRGISGTWSNSANMPAGCAVGLDIEYEYKESTWDHFRNYGRFRNHQQQTPNQPSFIAYGLKPDVTYEFRIVAVDAAGRKNESNVASATVRYDADATSDAHSPLNLRVQPDNNSGALVTWSAPASLAAGRTLSGYVVQWLSGGVNSTTVAAGTTSHRITGLTDGTVYRVRVAARTSGTNPSSHDAWTAFSTPFTAWSEPTQVWFADQTPHIFFNTVIIETATNKAWATITCVVQSTGAPSLVSCPVGNRVEHAPTGGITSGSRWGVTATATIGDKQTSAGVNGKAGGPSGLEATVSAGADPSDGDATTHEGKITIAWERPSTVGVSGTLRYYVGRRSGTSGSFGNWTATTDRSFTYEGLADGTYGVTVLGTAVTIGDHDGNPLTDPEEIETDGFSAGAYTVIVAAANTAAPDPVTGGTVTPGPGSLIAEWEPPEGKVSAAHAYQVRHRDYLASGHRSDDVGWTEGPVLLPRQTLRICDPNGCENPRSYSITGLVGGNRYDVAVRAKNANGWGAWHFIGIRNVADGFTPVLQSAAVNAASLTLTFDRTIDTDSKPDKSAFTVTVAGTDQTPTAVSISDKTVTLTLGTAVTSGQTVTVSYDRPDESPLQHSGTQAQSFSDVSVTNNTP